VGCSWRDGGAVKDWDKYFEITPKGEQKLSQYRGKKIAMEVVCEAYFANELNFKEGVYETFLHRNKWAIFSITADHLKFYLGTFLKQNIDHSQEGDKKEIQPVYDRGNDFYNWFLGPRMIYTSGIWRSRDDSLEEAQDRKLDTVCKYVQMKEGMRHLDIGCGWGTLLRYAVKNYKTQSFGVTLAAEQKKWHEERCAEEGISTEQSQVAVMDYRLIPANKKFDVITCLEMAEHVGIKNFQKFLLQVKELLVDDGIFYLQIAGLRRPWQYEDAVWGLFMGKYIFPGADASCPLGWVASQLERAGFEIHRVENCGVHYSLTIKAWYDNWVRNKEEAEKKYPTWYRLWAVFLAWSAIIAAQGTSTVFMITVHKNHKNDKSSVASDEPTFINRTDRWVGPDPVATQQ